MSGRQSSSFFKRGRLVSGLAVVIVASVVAMLLLTGAALAGIRWTANGVAVTTGGGVSAYSTLVISDGSGGAITAWLDGTNLRVQRLNSSGTAQWPAGGVVVCSGSPTSPAMANDNSNGAILTWISNVGGYHLYAQRVGSGGNLMWATGVNPGVPICVAGGTQSRPDICEGGSGGAIIAWQDTRGGGGTYPGFWAQRVDSSGTVLWAADGVAACIQSPLEIPPTYSAVRVINPGILTWTDQFGSLGNPRVHAQKLDPTDGHTLWTVNTSSITVTATSYHQKEPAITTDGSGGAIIAWNDGRVLSPAYQNVYAQRLESVLGARQWGADGVPLRTLNDPGGYNPIFPCIVSDNAGGAVVAWKDSRSGIYTQRVNNAGTAQWTAEGNAFTNSAANWPAITTDGSGGAIASWTDWRSGSYNVYAQRVASDGQMKWTGQGVPVCTVANDPSGLITDVASDTLGGAIVTWDDSRAGGSGRNVYAQKVANDAPTVAGITPNRGFNNGTVNCTITGTGFSTPGTHAKLNKDSTYIYGTNNVIVNDTTLTCDFDLNGQPFGLYDACVMSGDGLLGVGSNMFIVRSARPVISALNPTQAAAGQVVTITGGGFGDTMASGRNGGGSTYVTFGTVQATEYSEWTDTEIKCTVPQGATSGGVTVTNATGTSDAAAISIVYPTWYLAEGSTAWGFSTYITIENPNNTACMAQMTYMPTGAANVSEDIYLPANSQSTIGNDHLVQVMGGIKDFSTQVTCKEGKTIAVDRTMSWTGPGAKSPEGHASVGVNAPNSTWYLPEGSTAWGFECWLLIQNPNAQTANCQVTYMIEGEGPRVFNKTVPGNSRATFDMSKDIGARDASIKVVGDVPVIAERAMYRNNRREGHESIGTTATATDYFLAEGAIGYASGFTTYVLVQNPQSTPTNVTITYMTQNGAVTGPAFQMPANTRKTIRVNDQLPGYTDVSTQVHGSQPIIAERAMYWGASSSLGEACHDSIGLDFPHMTFYLPDGQTTGGYETWTLVQNPNPGAVTVQITYMTPSGANNVVFTDEIPAGSRKTYNMANKISGRAAVMVQSLDGARPVMVERSMYWNSRGAGTDTIGGYSD
jgi:IPT/TIG domain